MFLTMSKILGGEEPKFSRGKKFYTLNSPDSLRSCFAFLKVRTHIKLSDMAFVLTCSKKFYRLFILRLVLLSVKIKIGLWYLQVKLLCR